MRQDRSTEYITNNILRIKENCTDAFPQVFRDEEIPPVTFPANLIDFRSA